MDFIRRLNREHFYFSSQSFHIWWHISGIEVRKKHKISAQYLKKYAFKAKKTPGHGDTISVFHFASIVNNKLIN